MHKATCALSSCLLFAMLTTPSSALAQQEAQPRSLKRAAAEENKTPLIKKEGWRTKFSLAYRSRPLGLALFNDTGYRKRLTESESLLRKNTYIEGGIYTITSPAYFRSGLYVEAVPLSILQLRSTVQVAQFYGTFGFLLVAEDPAQDPDWSVPGQEASADADRGVPGRVFFWENTITPRIKVGRVVALAETRHVYLRSNLEQTYYEPFYDMLLNTSDHVVSFKPTLGFLPIQNDNTYLLTAARYDRTHAFGKDIDTSQLNALIIWGLPKSWVKNNTLTVTSLFGYWLDHPMPTRDGTAYVALQLGAIFGAQ